MTNWLSVLIVRIGKLRMWKYPCDGLLSVWNISYYFFFYLLSCSNCKMLWFKKTVKLSCWTDRPQVIKNLVRIVKKLQKYSISVNIKKNGIVNKMIKPFAQFTRIFLELFLENAARYLGKRRRRCFTYIVGKIMLLL
jgi:hypothetical protein